MTKQEAINLLGGKVTTAALLIGITPSAVSQWTEDEDLPQRIVDRVQAALWRKAQGMATPEADAKRDREPV